MKHTTLDGRVFLREMYEQARHNFGAVAFEDLHPDTAPAAIAARHCRMVEKASRRYGTDVRRISRSLILPECTVRRHLEALGKLTASPPADAAMRLSRGQAAELVRQCLANAKEMLQAKQIAAATGCGYQTVYYVLKSRDDLYEATAVGRYRGCTVYAWKLKKTA